MDVQFKLRKRKMGLLFGLIAGFAFAVMAWGVDAAQLAQSHSALPFAKFIPGLVMSMLAAGLVGWLSIRIEKVWAAIVLWVGLAFFLTWQVVWLPLHFSPFYLTTIDPRLMDLLYYPMVDSQDQFWAFSFIVIIFVSALCGLLEIHLIEQSLLGQGSLAVLTPLLVTMALFGFAGVSADDLVNTHFREPMVALDNLIQFAIDNEGKEVPPIVARKERLSVVKDLYGLIDRPRSLTLTGFDKTLGQMEILVNFGGKWVRCTVIYNQPTMCKIAGLELEKMRYAGV